MAAPGGKPEDLSRRAFFRRLGLGLGGLALCRAGLETAPAAPAAESGNPDDYDFVFSRLMFRDLTRGRSQWNLDPSCDENFLNNLKKVVRINVPTKPPKGSRSPFTYAPDLANRAEVLRFPFLFMTDNRSFELPGNERRNLKEFLDCGGFLFADDCVEGNSGDFFFQAMIALVPKMYPGLKMELLPDDHPVNNCYFNLGATPFFQGKDHGTHGLYLDGRLAIVLTPGDIHCGWSTLSDAWFGAGSFQQAMKIGVNVVVFALTQQGKLRPEDAKPA